MSKISNQSDSYSEIFSSWMDKRERKSLEEIINKKLRKNLDRAGRIPLTLEIEDY